MPAGNPAQRRGRSSRRGDLLNPSSLAAADLKKVVVPAIERIDVVLPVTGLPVVGPATRALCVEGDRVIGVEGAVAAVVDHDRVLDEVGRTRGTGDGGHRRTAVPIQPNARRIDRGRGLSGSGQPLAEQRAINTIDAFLYDWKLEDDAVRKNAPRHLDMRIGSDRARHPNTGGHSASRWLLHASDHSSVTAKCLRIKIVRDGRKDDRRHGAPALEPGACGKCRTHTEVLAEEVHLLLIPFQRYLDLVVLARDDLHPRRSHVRKLQHLRNRRHLVGYRRHIARLER